MPVFTLFRTVVSTSLTGGSAGLIVYGISRGNNPPLGCSCPVDPTAGSQPCSQLSAMAPGESTLPGPAWLLLLIFVFAILVLWHLEGVQVAILQVCPQRPAPASRGQPVPHRCTELMPAAASRSRGTGWRLSPGTAARPNCRS